MFADPLANVTLSGALQTLPRTSTGTDRAGNPFAIYTRADGLFLASLKQTAKREANVDRKVASVMFDWKFVAPDPYNAEAGNKDFHSRVTLLIDRPLVVVTQTNIVDQVTAMTGFLTASTNAALVKLFGGET